MTAQQSEAQRMRELAENADFEARVTSKHGFAGMTELHRTRAKALRLAACVVEKPAALRAAMAAAYGDHAPKGANDAK